MKKIRSFTGFTVIFLVLFFYFVNQNSHLINSEGHITHKPVEIPEGYTVPSVEVKVSQDRPNTWLLHLKTKHFTFAPDKVGSDIPSYNEGHVHLYINGEKINRLYGNYFNLGDLEEGKTKIRVSLHSNNHGALVYKGKPIENSEIVEVSSYTW
ncbi:hypothetical protein [Virgibacillus subterraneus]|nr:hypothetical protein [Virgibacillus subterraneus]